VGFLHGQSAYEPASESRWTTWGTVSSGFREIEIGRDRLESVAHLAPFLAPTTPAETFLVDSARSIESLDDPATTDDNASHADQQLGDRETIAPQTSHGLLVIAPATQRHAAWRSLTVDVAPRVPQ